MVSVLLFFLYVIFTCSEYQNSSVAKAGVVISLSAN